MNYTGRKLKKKRKTGYCPFLASPFDDCYCMTFTGEDVEKILFYCICNFKECHLYRKNFKLPVEEKKLNFNTGG